MRSGLIPMRIRRYVDCARLNVRAAGLFLRNRWIRPADVAHSYNRLAAGYDSAWLVHLRDTTLHLLASLPRDLPKGSVLDLGCGTGFAARRLAERFPDRVVSACDISSGRVVEARRRPGAEAVSWNIADFHSFLFSCPASSVALAVAAWSAGYGDFRRICRETNRILAPGGVFALVVNLADTLAPLQRAFRYCMQAHAADLNRLAHFSFPRSVDTVRRDLLVAGFRIDHFEDGFCPIEPPPSSDGRRLPWLLQTGTLAGFDAMLPLDRPGPCADTFEARLAADPEPIRHHYALAVAVRL